MREANFVRKEDTTRNCATAEVEITATESWGAGRPISPQVRISASRADANGKVASNASTFVSC